MSYPDSMELNHLRYFYEVAKAGSFTSAARLLRVSQPSLSKAVALLEARQGVKLLERSKVGVALTPLGSEIFQECEKVFSTLREVEKLCQGTRSVCGGPLRLGASDHIAHYLLPDALQDMVRRHPTVEPSIFVGAPHDITQMLLRREIEFGLFFTKVKAPQIRYRSLMPLKMTAVFHPDLKAVGSGKTRSKSLPQRYIGSIKKDYSQYPAEDSLRALMASPDVHFQTNSQEMQKRLCLRGAGLAILARFMVEDELARGELVEAPLPKGVSMDLLLATRSGSELSLNAKTFLSLLQKDSVRQT